MDCKARNKVQHENDNNVTRRTLDRYYAALQREDLEALRKVVSEDIVVSYGDTSNALPWGGVWTGFDEFCAFLKSVGQHLSIDEITPERTVFEGNAVIVFLSGRWTALSTRKRVQAKVVNVFEINDEKVSRYSVFADTAAFSTALKR